MSCIPFSQRKRISESFGVLCLKALDGLKRRTAKTIDDMLQSTSMKYTFTPGMLQGTELHMITDEFLMIGLRCPQIDVEMKALQRAGRGLGGRKQGCYGIASCGIELHNDAKEHLATSTDREFGNTHSEVAKFRKLNCSEGDVAANHEDDELEKPISILWHVRQQSSSFRCALFLVALPLMRFLCIGPLISM
jgi:hypothetical protein